MGCPQPALETPQKTLPCSRVVPSSEGATERVMGGTVSDVGSKVMVSSAAPLLLGVTMKPHEGPARDIPSSEPWGKTDPAVVSHGATQPQGSSGPSPGGPVTLEPRVPSGPSPRWAWGPEAPGTQWPTSSVDLGDFPCGVAKLLCVGPSAEGSTHPHKAPCPVLVLSSFTRGSLSLAPGTQAGLPPASSTMLPHPWATGVRVPGPTVCKYPQGHRSCCWRVPGQYLGVTVTNAREKLPPAP